MAPKRNIRLTSLPAYFTLLLFALVFLSLSTTSMIQKSATFDEPNKLIAGYANLKWHDYRLSPDHPPLARMITALPLLGLEIPDSRMADGRWDQSLVNPTPQMIFTSAMLHQGDADRILFRGRIVVVTLGVLLGCLVFFWAKDLYGQAGAIMALFLYGLDPNILAHTRLATSDLALALFFFLSIYGFYLTCKRFTLLSALICSFSIACAVLTKHTGWLALFVVLFLGAIMTFSAERWPVGIRGSKSLETKQGKLLLLIGFILVTGAVIYLTIWASYGFRYRAVPDPMLPLSLAPRDPLPSSLSVLFHWLKEVKLFPEAYLEGILLSLSRLQSGYHFFLLGSRSTEGWWYYFIIAFLAKTPLITLLLIGLAFGVVVNKRMPLRRSEVFLLVPVGIYFLITSFSQYNLGLRYILPIYPFLFVFVARLAPFYGTIRDGRKKLVGILFAAWYLISSQSIYPHYLAYFNELVGGPENGHKVLVDSNLDWGQDLKGLRTWMDENQVEVIGLSYFGTADPRYYGIPFVYLPSVPFYYPRQKERDFGRPRYLALSATNLQGVFLSTDDRRILAPFLDIEPIAKIGYSIFVYKVP